MKPKIVVIEDDELLLKALNVVLLDKGYDVISATDGLKGEEVVKQTIPDCVLLDIMLPGKNGFDILSSLRADEKTKAVPVIILSNMGQDEDMKKGLALGAQDYFIKSNTDITSVTEKIERFLVKPPPPQPSTASTNT